MKIETEQIYKLVKEYGGVLTDDRHFMDDVEHLLKRSDNSDYEKCKHTKFDGETTKPGCKNWYIQNGFDYKYCPYCGKEVEHFA